MRMLFDYIFSSLCHLPRLSSGQQAGRHVEGRNSHATKDGEDQQEVEDADSRSGEHVETLEAVDGSDAAENFAACPDPGVIPDVDTLALKPTYLFVDNFLISMGIADEDERLVTLVSWCRLLQRTIPWYAVNSLLH